HDPGQRDGEQQQREGQEDVHQPVDDGVDPPTEVTGDDAHDGADDHRQDRGAERDEQRVLGADQDPGQHVATELRVDAQRVREADATEEAGGRVGVHVDEVLVVGRDVENPGVPQEHGDDGQHDQHDDDDAAGHGPAV